MTTRYFVTKDLNGYNVSNKNYIHLYKGFKTREEAQKYANMLNIKVEKLIKENEAIWVQTLKEFGLHNWHKTGEIIPIFSQKILENLLSKSYVKIVKRYKGDQKNTNIIEVKLDEKRI